MKTIRCRFKNITTEDKAKIQVSTPLVLISVGQESHEGNKLRATIELLNKSIHACTISLYDSLQRYTMALNSTHNPEYFHQLATQEGDLWLKRNQPYLKELTIPYNVYRWDTWLNHDNFQEQKLTVLKAIESDIKYAKAFDDTIETYLNRYLKHHPDPGQFNLQRAQKICYDYIVEECVVLCLWPQLQCNYEIYPSKHNTAIEATRERFINNTKHEILSPLTLRFSHAKQPSRQTFISQCIDTSKITMKYLST